LLGAARRAAQFFEKLCERYAAAAEGYRAKIYEFAADCYEIGLGYKNELVEFNRFMADPFWVDVRQKPKNDKIMRAVLTFAMKAKSKQLLNRVSKTAAVLESLAEQEIDASEAAEHLKAGGGIERMYRDLSPNRNNKSRVPDDLELISQANTEDGEDDNGEGEENSSGDAWWDPEKPVEEDQDLDVGADDADRRVPASPAASRAASDVITVADFGGQTSPPKAPRPPTRFDPSKYLVIDLSDTGVSPQKALGMEKLCIMAVVGPPDENGWRPVRAVSVTQAARTSGLWKNSDSHGDGE
jgi:hypothetical protein